MDLNGDKMVVDQQFFASGTLTGTLTDRSGGKSSPLSRLYGYSTRFASWKEQSKKT